MRKFAGLFFSTLFSFQLAAQAAAATPSLPGLPQQFHWRNDPITWSAKDGKLTIESAPKTDWYIAPTGNEHVATSPLLLFPAPENFAFSAKVTVSFKSRFDAGALIVYADEQNWLKFAFESQNGRSGSIVSVVTRALSDDVTGTPIEGDSVYLKVSKTGQSIFLFFSVDGRKWNLTRAFNLGATKALQFGFSAQSPEGAGAMATFSDIDFKPVALKPWSAE